MAIRTKYIQLYTKYLFYSNEILKYRISKSTFNKLPGVLLNNRSAANPVCVCLTRFANILSNCTCISLLVAGVDTMVNVVLQIASLVDKQVLSLQ